MKSCNGKWTARLPAVGGFWHQRKYKTQLKQIATEEGLKKVAFNSEFTGEGVKIEYDSHYEHLTPNISGHEEGPHNVFSGLSIIICSEGNDDKTKKITERIKEYVCDPSWRDPSSKRFSEVFYGSSRYNP
ncbi:hypothetical protein COU60_03700 [Candidatus Pacearchaeota archaeon CG10_big_fil_rev_8_21_14_0_10_34_76]|nr:MAG: hypothetical protein COU60_03700 [Candidatus Pacearchaeota archaeon CG10_big_fil_rev_8_21_14_0_10_34_76]